MQLTNKELETIKTWALADFQRCTINRSDSLGLEMTRCFVDATIKFMNEKIERETYVINRNDADNTVQLCSYPRTKA